MNYAAINLVGLRARTVGRFLVKRKKVRPSVKSIHGVMAGVAKKPVQKAGEV